MKRMDTALVILLAASLGACAPAEEEPAEEVSTLSTTMFRGGQNVYPFMIGSLYAAAMRDGGFSIPNDNRTLATNQNKADVDALLTANGLSTETLELSIQPLIVRTPDGILLFDTGNGPANGQLMAALTEAGAEPGQVTDIFISHGHGDHVNGLLDADGGLAFPNATIHVSANEWTAIQGNAQMAALVTAVTPRVSTFQPGAELVPGTVTAVDIQGHTPGHSGYMIISGTDSILFMGDTMHHSVISVQRPDWTIAFDGNARVAQESRRALLAQTAASGQRIYAVHFPFPGLGRFQDYGGVHQWVPE